MVFCNGGSLWIYRCESHTLVPPIGRILHGLNLKASSYKTLDYNFRHCAWLPTPYAWNISEGTRIRIPQGQVNLQAGRGNKDIFESQLARQVSQVKRPFSTGKKTYLLVFNQTINSHYKCIFRIILTLVTPNPAVTAIAKGQGFTILRTYMTLAFWCEEVGVGVGTRPKHSQTLTKFGLLWTIWHTEVNQNPDRSSHPSFHH